MNPSLIYLARHATPDWGRFDLPYHLPPGPPLLEQGRQEAAVLAVFLQSQGVNRVFASPLERCQHTAQIVADCLGLAPEIHPGLQEWQPGEEPQGVRARLWPVFSAAAEWSRRAGPAVLISHGGPIAVLLAELGLPETTLLQHRIYDHRNPLPPAGAWRAVQAAPDSPWELQLVFTPNGNL
jgi:broad specificity phosphatase PhoE